MLPSVIIRPLFAQSLGGEHMSDLSGDSKADLPDLGQAPGAELGMAPETTE